MRNALKTMFVGFSGSAALVGISVSGLLSPVVIASAGESVTDKFGDGLRHGIEDVLTPNKVDPKPAPSPPAPRYSATYRVDCIDSRTGADRADNTITATAASVEAARSAIIEQYTRSDLCQANGDKSRITRAGSGRWM